VKPSGQGVDDGVSVIEGVYVLVSVEVIVAVGVADSVPRVGVVVTEGVPVKAIASLKEFRTKSPKEMETLVGDGVIKDGFA
jgi:hypothetical protein